MALGAWLFLFTSQTVFGSAAENVGEVVQSATGSEIETGFAAENVGQVTQVAFGLEIETGVGAQNIGQVTQAASGFGVESGIGAQNVGQVDQTALGVEVVSGAAAQVLSQIVESAVGNGGGGVPINPLLSPLAQGGSDTSEWWQQRKDVFTEQYGYVRLAPDFDPQVAWEFNESDFAPGKPITLAAFTSKLVSGARSEEREALFSKKLDEMLERQRAEYAQHQKIVKVTLTSAGVTLVLWKLLPLL
jgi:hypothetical protein